MANPAPKPTYIPIFGGMTAWAISTYYALGQRVTANGNIYQATTAGTSAGAGTGPSGSGGAIADNTVVWAFQYATYDAWVALTAYTLGQRVSNSGNVYQCVTAGTSGNTGGPTGTGGAFLDGNVYWAYVYALVAEVVTPTAQTADTGAITNASLAAAYFNKLFQGVVGWIYYLRTFTDAAQTWTATNIWNALTFMNRTSTFAGLNSSLAQSDVTPSIIFDVLDAGTWKLVERASDSDNLTDAKPLRYVAGHGAPGPGAEAFVNNAVWNPAMGGTWSCIDTGASATMRVQATQGFYWLSHAATGSAWTQGQWSIETSIDATTGELLNTANINSIALLQAQGTKSAVNADGFPFPSVDNGQIALESVANGWAQIASGGSVQRGLNITQVIHAGAGNLEVDFTGPFTDAANCGLYWSVNGQGDLVTAECTANVGVGGVCTVIIAIYKWTTPAGVLTQTQADYPLFLAVVGK